MDAALAVEIAALAHQKSANDVIARGDSPVQQFYKGTTVFVTGGSGFVGKQLIEILFRTCKIKKIYILLRLKKIKTIKERLSDILNDPMFASLYINQPDFENRLVPVEGDIAKLGLGIDNEVKQKILEEVEVIFHVAATIGFQEPLRIATLTNVRGTRELISMAKLCKRLKSFVHISTAYSHATITRVRTKILEQFYPCPLSPELMIKLAEEIQEDRLFKIQEGLTHDWPNTYSFTKALAEELIRASAGDLPLCIIKPSIVICSKRGPCPGWVDISSVYGPSGMTLGTTMGVIRVLYARQEIKIDFVPVDYVCNAAIVAATRAREQPMKIYQIGSSHRNHITWGELSYFLSKVAVSTVISEQAMWCSIVFQTSKRWVYLTLIYLLHDVPAIVIDGICALLNRPQRLKKMYAKINKIGIVLAPYTNNDWNFVDKNTLELYQSLSEADRVIYHHDVADIVWADMIILWYVGLRKYIVKDGLNNTKLGLKRQLYFKIITFIDCVLMIYLLFLLLSYIF